MRPVPSGTGLLCLKLTTNARRMANDYPLIGGRDGVVFPWLGKGVYYFVHYA